MQKTYQVQIFGKAGCEKCDRLKSRLKKILDKEEWNEFDSAYFDIESEDGIINFCAAECLNPQRIPAMLVTRLNPETGEYEPMANPKPGTPDPICGKSRLYQYLGIQTDYTGSGSITPKMLTAILAAAR